MLVTICQKKNSQKDFQQVGDSLVCNGTNIQITQAPACNEFGYNEYLAITNIQITQAPAYNEFGQVIARISELLQTN